MTAEKSTALEELAALSTDFGESARSGLSSGDSRRIRTGAAPQQWCARPEEGTMTPGTTITPERITPETITPGAVAPALSARVIGAGCEENGRGSNERSSCVNGEYSACVHDEGIPSRRNERGMVSAEWAVGIIAAVAIAGVLLAIVTSGPVQDALLKFILQVIHSFSGFLK
jgi:Protein of unknown function (DUF4244)